MPRKEPAIEFKRIVSWPAGVPMPPAREFRAREPWSDEDNEAMIEYYHSYGKKYLMRLLGRSERSIVGRAWTMGISRPAMAEWTPDEDNYLRKHYAKTTAPELAVDLGRSEQAVRHRLRAIGLTVQVSTAWSKDEIAYLKKHYGKVRGAEIAATLGRTGDAIEIKAGRIGIAKHARPPLSPQARRQVIARLGKTAYTVLAEEFDTSVHIITAIATDNGYRDRPQSRPWTEDDDAMLRKLYGTMSRTAVAKRLDRTMVGVASRASLLGITRKHKRSKTKRWTRKEEARLRILARTHSIEEIATKLGRSRGSTYGKMQGLGVYAANGTRKK